MNGLRRTLAGALERAGASHGSLTLRLAITYALFGGAIVAILLGLSYWQFSEALRVRAHAELGGEWKLVQKEIERLAAGTLAAPDLTGEHLKSGALRGGHPGLNVVLMDAGNANVIASLGDEAKELADLARTRTWTGITEFEWPACLMAALAGTARSADGRDLRLIVGLDRTEDRLALAAHQRSLAISWAVAIVLIGLAAWILARRSLAPLHDFTRQVAEISVMHLDRRLDAGTIPAELRDLAATFNNLLARLDDAFNRLNAFSSDLAHELRGPLTNLMGKTQLALTRARDAAAYRQALESNAEELERLTRMVSDMLFLARAENAALALRLERVDLGALCRRIAEFYAVAAEERGIRIEVHGEGSVEADENLIQRALGNLLSNALRHTPDGETVKVRIDLGGAPWARIEVSNPGSAIAPELQRRLFTRFVRGDQSRQREAGGEGVGLGLAIVRSIMNLHGGDVVLDSPPNGSTTFALKFRS